MVKGGTDQTCSVFESIFLLSLGAIFCFIESFRVLDSWDVRGREFQRSCTFTAG